MPAPMMQPTPSTTRSKAERTRLQKGGAQGLGFMGPDDAADTQHHQIEGREDAPAEGQCSGFGAKGTLPG